MNIRLWLKATILAGLIATAAPVFPADPYEAEVLYRYAVSEDTRLDQDTIVDRFNEGKLFDGVNYFSAAEPPGVIKMRCDSVDSFGVMYRLEGWHDDRHESPKVRVRVKHPGIDSDDGRFSYSQYVRYRPTGPYPVTSGFRLRDEDKINGVFTLEVSMKGRVLFTTEFELTECDDPAVD